jgi:hypothetical protein
MERLDLNGRRSGKMKTHCPLCRDRRKNKRDRSVSVDIDKGIAFCHYCGVSFQKNKKKEDAALPYPVRPAFIICLKEEFVIFALIIFKADLLIGIARATALASVSK